MSLSLLVAATAIGLSLTAAAPAQQPEAAAAEASTELAQALKAGKRKLKSVAALEFTERGPKASGWGQRASGLWGSKLAETTGMNVETPERVAQLLADKKNAALAKKPFAIGKKLGAQAVLVGEVMDQGSQLTVTSRLVLVATGAVIASSRQSFSASAPPPAEPAQAAAPVAPAPEQPAAEPAAEPAAVVAEPAPAPVVEEPAEKPAAVEPAPKPVAEAPRAGGIESSSVEVLIRKLADRIAEGFSSMPGSGRYRRLAVLPFSDVGEDAQKRELGAIITAEVATVLRRDHNLLLVERSQLAAVVGELKLQELMSDEPESKVKLGEMADAQAVVIGSVAGLADGYMVNARIVSTKNGQALVADSVKLPAAGLVALASDAVVLRSRSGAIFRSVLIPGWGQFYNRQAWKGWVFIGTELAVFGSAIGFHVAGNQAYADYTSKTSADALGENPSAEAERLYDTASSRYRYRNVLLGVGAGIWLLNIVDAFASGVDGESMLSGSVSAGPVQLSPLVAGSGDGATFGFTGRW
jgi:TolB-like protein